MCVKSTSYRYTPTAGDITFHSLIDFMELNVYFFDIVSLQFTERVSITVKHRLNLDWVRRIVTGKIVWCTSLRDNLTTQRLQLKVRKTPGREFDWCKGKTGRARNLFERNPWGCSSGIKVDISSGPRTGVRSRVYRDKYSFFILTYIYKNFIKLFYWI